NLFAFQVRLYRLQPFADGRISSGLDERDCPVVDIAVQEMNLLATLRPDKVVGYGLVVVQEIVFDSISFMSETQDEVLVAEVSVVFHQMPKNRARPDLDHGLWDVVGVSPEPHPGSSAK